MNKLNLSFAVIICLLSVEVFGQEKDAAGCNANPLIPKIPNYYIVTCNELPAGADLDIIKGNETETVHFEGKSTAYIYKQQLAIKTKPNESKVRSLFEDGIKKNNGILYGVTFGQKWPVYSIENEGKKFWIILMINSGKYFTGSYACRIIEKE